MKAISLHSVVPVRAQAKETAEQSTQMLFAETCEVLSVRGNWTKVRLDQDGEQGWVDSKMIAPLEANQTIATGTARVKTPMAYAVSMNNGQTIPLTAGTCLPDYKEGVFSLLGVQFRIDPSMVAEKALTMSQDELLQTVRFFLNIPYLWGGKNAMGLDCSGFVQTIMSLFGYRLPRNASQQAGEGKQIKSRRDVHPGDLIFFDHAEQASETPQPIIHVGIALDKDRIIHCSGRVKVEKWDDNGIYSAEYGRYTHHLAAIRRL